MSSATVSGTRGYTNKTTCLGTLKKEWQQGIKDTGLSSGSVLHEQVTLSLGLNFLVWKMTELQQVQDNKYVLPQM